MTISDDTIKKAVQRYHREYDRYLKLAARVAEICSNVYRASHIEVFLTAADGVGTYTNAMDVPCEVQVCSMMAHVWNEIEHDLGYKLAAGVLADHERTFLVMLGQSVRMGDGTIASLFAETERRQREQSGAFTDVYDFVARLRGWFAERFPEAPPTTNPAPVTQGERA